MKLNIYTSDRIFNSLPHEECLIIYILIGVGDPGPKGPPGSTRGFGMALANIILSFKITSCII